MKQYLPMSISIGIVAALWVFIANLFGLLSWPAFVGWSVYFYGGANMKAIKDGSPCLMLGSVLAYFAVIAQSILPSNELLLMLPIFILAFLMTYAQNLDLFKIAPATFLGAALYFGTGTLFDSLILSIFGLAFLGIISSKLTELLEGKSESKT